MKRGIPIMTLVLVGFALYLVGCGTQNQATGFKLDKEEGGPRSAAVPKESQPVATSKAAGVANAQEVTFKPFRVYTDANSPDNHYIPSGWMGDWGDITFDDRHLTNPHSGTTSIKIVYNGKAAQGARWAGIYWQNPANNWGTRPGGYDLTGAQRLVFWARGEKGGERIEEFKIGGIAGEYADSDEAGIGPVVLTQEWKRYVIGLEGRDLSSISGGFCWATNIDVNPEGATFYLDDLRYE